MIRIKHFILLIIFFIFSINSINAEKKIHKGLLKYSREKAVEWADKYWGTVADGYINYGSKMIDPDDPAEPGKKRILEHRDCFHYNVQVRNPITGSIECGGDCANFVSQCLIKGGIPAEALTDGACFVTKGQVTPTIRTAKCLGEQLEKMGVYDNEKNLIIKNEVRVFNLSDLDLGDVVTLGTPPPWHSVLIGIRGTDSESIGVYTHSYSTYPKAKVLTGILGRYIRSFSGNYHLYHIPDVPVIKDVEIFRNNADGSKKLFYKASLDDNANNGDGVIVPERNKRVLDTINPTLGKDKKIILKIIFNYPVKIDHKEHKVQLVKYKTRNVTETDKKSNNYDTSQAQMEDIVIELSKPSLSSDKKTIEYILPITNEQLINNPGEWTIKIRTFSDSDETPLNGAGTYEKYKDEPDINHFLMIRKIPQLVVKDCEIGKLHLPLMRFAPPPRIANMQPLTLDGRIETPDWFWSRLSQCRSEKNPAYCEQFFTKLILEDTIHPVYYLSKPLILQQAVDWLAVLDTSFITKLFQPAYVAELKADTELKPYVLDGSIYDYVKLYLDIQPFGPSAKKYGNNAPSGNRISYEIPKELFRVYYYTEEPYKTEGCVLLPLFYLYLVNNSLSNNLPDGFHTIRIETTDGGTDKEKKLYSSESLTFFKDFEPPENTGSIPGSGTIELTDNTSGFDNYHFHYQPARQGSNEFTKNWYDMAYNSIDLGISKTDSSSDDQESPKSIDPNQPPKPDPEKDIPEFIDNIVLPDKRCTQYHDQNCRSERVTSCHIKTTCNSIDWAICYVQFGPYFLPVATEPTTCETTNVEKDVNKECENNETYPDNKKYSSTCNWDVPDWMKDKSRDDSQGGEPGKEPGVTGGESDSSQQQTGGGKSTPGGGTVRPQILNIDFAKTDKNEVAVSSTNGIILTGRWVDNDNDIDLDRVSISLYNKVSGKEFFKNLNISQDLSYGNLTQKGFRLENTSNLYEGNYWVKVYVEDKTYKWDSKASYFEINAGSPHYTKGKWPVYSEKTGLWEINVTDYGTPAYKLQIDCKVNDQDCLLNIHHLNNYDTKILLKKPEIKGSTPNILNFKIKDMAGNIFEPKLDINDPNADLNYDNNSNMLTSNQQDIFLESDIDKTRTELRIDGSLYQAKYDTKMVNNQWRMTFYTGNLSEGDHKATVKVWDYTGNSTFIGPLDFRVSFPPKIIDFNYNGGSFNSLNLPQFTATISDRGKNVDPDKIILKVNGVVQYKNLYRYDETSERFEYLAYGSLPSGDYTAELIAEDKIGNATSKIIEFKSLGAPELILIGKVYRDVEGNGDGVINEAERIYLDLEVRNAGDGGTKNVWGELINRSRYIKGVAEARARYGFLEPGNSAVNHKPFEFTVNEKVFEREDIDRVEAEFVLQLVDLDYYSGKSRVTDLPFTLVIERMDPAMALFEINVTRPPAQTLEPALRLEGGWKTFGTDLRNLDIKITQDSQPATASRNSLAAFTRELTVVKDDARKTFYADALLGVGENRFVVTAVADNGAVRTAEVSVRLDSRVGIKLDLIADTKQPNITVTGTAWTENSKLERVEIYLNGGFAGNAALNADRFSLPVVLNGGENIIRAVARDDNGKSAADEIKVNMHGPLTLRWQRPHWRTTETPVAACGSYEVEGDDIASIVTYVNNAPNTYEVVIDRNLKTFCTKADLQPGSNLLRAVGITTGGITAEAYSRIDYQTGGTLYITLDPVTSPTTELNQVLTGSFTLATSDPYTITINVEDCEGNNQPYTPTVNPVTNTFNVNINLHSPIPDPYSSDNPDDNVCDTRWCDHSVTATIQQGGNFISDVDYIQTVDPIDNLGVSQTNDFFCGVDTSGWIEGDFVLNAPADHIASITCTLETMSGSTIPYNVTIYDEIAGIWHLDFDMAPERPEGTFEAQITDSFGNSAICSGVIWWCQSNKDDPIPINPDLKKGCKRCNKKQQKEKKIREQIEK